MVVFPTCRSFKREPLLLKMQYISFEFSLPLPRLRPIDVKFMKELHQLVNIIPVIAKADTLTPNEVKALKQKACEVCV